MRRGQVCWVDLDPTRGSEANKIRPAVLVSNDGNNRAVERLGRGTMTVVPITSSIAHVHPFQVLLDPAESGLERESKAQAEQVRTVGIGRVRGVAGVLGPATMRAVDDALRLHLGL